MNGSVVSLIFHPPFFVFVLGDSVLMLILVINVGPVPPDSPTLIATTMGPSTSSSFSTSSSSTAGSAFHSSHPQKGWSKQNLRQSERSAWTRGRDGWSGVEGSSGGVRWGFFFFFFQVFFFLVFAFLVFFLCCGLWFVVSGVFFLLVLSFGRDKHDTDSAYVQQQFHVLPHTRLVFRGI